MSSYGFVNILYFFILSISSKTSISGLWLVGATVFPSGVMAFSGTRSLVATGSVAVADGFSNVVEEDPSIGVNGTGSTVVCLFSSTVEFHVSPFCPLLTESGAAPPSVLSCFDTLSLSTMYTFLDRILGSFKERYSCICAISAGVATTGAKRFPKKGPPLSPISMFKNSSNQFVKLSPNMALCVEFGEPMFIFRKLSFRLIFILCSFILMLLNLWSILRPSLSFTYICVLWSYINAFIER